MDYELSELRKKLQGVPASGKAVTCNPGASEKKPGVPVLAVIGVGKERAQASVRRLLEEAVSGLSTRDGTATPNGTTDAETHQLLLLGVAGGVVPELGTGDLVLASRYFKDTQNVPALRPDLANRRAVDGEAVGKVADNTGTVTTTGTKIESALTPDSNMWELATQACVAEGPKANLVDSLTVDRVIGAPEHKRSIARAYPIGIVEMEDYWVAELAAEYGVAFLAARVVLDTVDQALPGWLLRMTHSRFRAALSLAAKPWRIPTVVRLARQRPVAQRSLTRFALNFLDQWSNGNSTLGSNFEIDTYTSAAAARGRIKLSA